MQNNPVILVTGGAGYIGSHTVQALQEEGYEVVIIDNLVYGHRDLIERLQAKLIVGDVGDRPMLDRVFADYEIAAVIHFAAYAYVGESFIEPAKYYRNNVAATLTLLEAMVAASVNRLVFSSTCATYGEPQAVPILEDDEQHPINPYGASKLMVERILGDFDRAYGLKTVIFRYFNAAGADPTGRLGEDHTPEPHLIPLILQTALGQRESVSIFGTDYPTSDGTCIRDYIHVVDLAQAHLLGLEYLLKEGRSNVFNLGNGSGFSVKQAIEMARQVTGKTIQVKQCDRRAGDPPILIASSEKARQRLGWQPQYPNLKDILGHAWNWHQQRHGSKEPLVSVIIPAYNAERFIARTLHSVLTQTYSKIEVIVVDDGSSDRTAEIVGAIAQQDKRVMLLQQPNSGVAAARNLGIQKAQGEFIAPIDADDIWYPENLEKQVKCLMEADPLVGLVYSWSVDIDENDVPTGAFRAAEIEGDVYMTLLCHNFLGNASASMFRRECIEKVGNYDREMRKKNGQGCEDWDLYLRIAENYQVRVVSEFLIGYRRFSESMSCDYTTMARSHELMLQTIQRKYPHIPSRVYQLSKSNFYMYFAHQSSRGKNHKKSFFWLLQALKADKFSPWIRIGLYRLFLINILDLIGSKPFMAKGRFLASLKPKTISQNRFKTLLDVKNQKGKIHLTLKVEELFHRLVPIVFGDLSKQKNIVFEE